VELELEEASSSLDEAVAAGMPVAGEGASAIDLDVLAVADGRAVSMLVTDILDDAIARDASHVHLLPYRDDFFLVYRVEGRLERVAAAPRSMQRALVDGFCGYARVPASRGDAPMWGRVRHHADGRDVVVTVSVVTTVAGPRLVAALGPVREAPPSFADLGMAQEQSRLLTSAAQRGRGLLLVAGPAGSRTDLTYRSLLAAAAGAGRTVLSIERSSTFEMPSVARVVAETQGVSVASSLRAGLLQDTDVLGVEGLSGAETLEVALEAAALGRLVVVSLQAGDALCALRRVLDLGADTVSLSQTLAAVIAQRLARTVCRSCVAEAASPLASLVPGLPPGTPTCAGTGCSACGGTGMRGTTGLFEILAVDERMRHELAAGADATTIGAMALDAGFRPMVTIGADLVAEGLLTPEELDRVVGLTAS
jgi:type IV pilus assembly protein PilB